MDGAVEGDDMSESTGIRHPVRELLDGPLDPPRVRSLETACARIAARPLDQVLAELRQVIAQPIGGEACRRAHVLISTIYHRHREHVPLRLTEELRAGIQAAQAPR